MRARARVFGERASLLARARAKCVTRLHNLAAHAKEPTDRVSEEC